MSLSAGRNPTGLSRSTTTSTNHTHEESTAAATTIHVEGGVTTLNGDPILTQDKLATYLRETDIPDDPVEDTAANRQVLEAVYLTGVALKDVNDNGPYLLFSQLPTDVTVADGQFDLPLIGTTPDTYLPAATLTAFLAKTYLLASQLPDVTQNTGQLNAPTGQTYLSTDAYNSFVYGTATPADDASEVTHLKYT